MQTLESPIRESVLDGAPQWLANVAPVDEGEFRPDVIERLERLDDVIFAAIDGDLAAREAAAAAWQGTLRDLGWESVEESRRQYLRRAQCVWDALREQPNHSPTEFFAIRKIILLFRDCPRWRRPAMSAVQR
jgi:hypothetical protein